MVESIGRYEIIYPIAAGGMARVYAGRLYGMAGFERLVAVKVIHPHLASERSFIEMFLDEARLAARIHHPNVAEILEVGEDEGRFYMVGELVLGKDLKEIALKSAVMGKTIPEPLIAEILADVCSGLEEAHNLEDEFGEPTGLVHRDISTRNILVSYKGFVKLIDFGVAWARGRLANTRDGSAKGKVGYMPPEQLRGEEVDKRADIFALGVVLYTLVVGTHPFPYENEGEQVTKILNGEFRRPCEARPGLDVALERIILKAMAISRDERYASAKEMEAALRAYSRSRGGGGGHVVLADLMTGIFQEEIASHEEKILKHRHLTKERGSLEPVFKDRKGGEDKSSSRITEVLNPSSSQGGDRRSSVIRRALHHATRNSKIIRKMTVGVVLLSILVTSLIVITISPESQNRADQETGRHSEKALSDAVRSEASMGRPEKRAPLEEAADLANVAIELEGLAADSKVYLDDQRVSTPIAVPQSRTPMSLRVTAPGYAEYTRVVVPDKDKTVQVSMQRMSREAPSDTETKKTRSHKKKRVGNKRRNGRTPPLEGWEENPFE